MTLVEKSTPLSEKTCPRIMLEGGVAEDHVVTLTSGNTYTCACGEVYQWDDQTHWQRVTETEEAA